MNNLEPGANLDSCETYLIDFELYLCTHLFLPLKCCFLVCQSFNRLSNRNHDISTAFVTVSSSPVAIIWQTLLNQNLIIEF